MLKMDTLACECPLGSSRPLKVYPWGGRGSPHPGGRGRAPSAGKERHWRTVLGDPDTDTGQEQDGLPTACLVLSLPHSPGFQ